jgi:hypothetical protein
MASRNLTPNPFPRGKGNRIWRAGIANDPYNLTPNPFPRGKGNRIWRAGIANDPYNLTVMFQ